MEKKEKKDWGILGSSADKSKLSLTLKSLVPLIVFGLGFFKIYTISENDLYQAMEAVIAAASAAGFAYGLLRKIYYKAKKKV
jgi:hypothetical protein